jgi:hypothetical protein
VNNIAEVENGLVPNLLGQSQRVLGLHKVTKATYNVAFVYLCGVELDSFFNTYLVLIELSNQTTEISV